LNFASQMVEAEHIGLNDPRAGGDSIEVERASVIGERNQASLTLCCAHGRARDRLAARLDCSRLHGNSL